MFSANVEKTEININEISDPVIREFLRLMGFIQSDEADSQGEQPIGELANELPSRETVLKVINLLKKA